MGPTEDEYGRLFVRISVVLIINFVVGMMAFMYAIDASAWGSTKDPSPLWEYYGALSMFVGFAAMMLWAGRWLIRRDKVLYGIYIAACVNYVVSQYFAYNAVTDAEYDAALQPWGNIMLLLILVAGLRLWVLHRRHQPTTLGVTVELMPKEALQLAFHTCDLFENPYGGDSQFAFGINQHIFADFDQPYAGVELEVGVAELFGRIKALEGVHKVMFSDTCFTVIVAEGFDRDDVLLAVLDVLQSQVDEVFLVLYDLCNEQATSDEERELFSDVYTHEGVRVKLAELTTV